MLFEEGTRYSGAWNFATFRNDAQDVEWIVKRLSEFWGEGARYTIDAHDNPHEAGCLALDNAKSENLLLWKPKWHIEQALRMTADWFKRFLSGDDAFILCGEHIDEYEAQV
jgi:CDP-glucose 4,6-dehydratase